LLDGEILNGEDLVQVGIRDHSNAEEYDRYAKDKGIHVYTMDDVEEEGVVSIIKKELTRLENQVDMIYLSVDMDAVDQAFAPGCPAIGPGEAKCPGTVEFQGIFILISFRFKLHDRFHKIFE